jgi:holo-[acyl-carrier protein] synthase
MSDSPFAPPVSMSRSSIAPQTRIGIDLVEVAAIEQSIAAFGARFTHRLFAARELRESTIDGRLCARALAMRFAAKEATIKAFDLSDAGVGWAQIEVVGIDDASARVRLHGRAAGSAGYCGSYEIAASLSQDGGLACAIVVATRASGASPDEVGGRCSEEEPRWPRSGAIAPEEERH